MNNKKIMLIILSIGFLILFLPITFKKVQKNNSVKSYDCKFIRTYKVYGIYESNDYDYLYVTIRKYQDEDIQTIKVLKSISDELFVGENYEFKYKQKSYIPSDDILSIHDNSDLVSIKITSLTGLKQLQEDYCN